MLMRKAAGLAWCVALLAAGGTAGQVVMTSEQSLSPYTGPVAEGGWVESLHGTVMCGYQGWFTARGDGYKDGFHHWGGVGDTPPSATVDMWPDMSELDDDEKFATHYRHADGSVAHVFSSTQRKTVLRHFKWMKDYGIDGVFVQRFAVAIHPGRPDHWNDKRVNAVLHHCREGANTHGRAFAVMYDCDFDRATCDKIMADWDRLVNRMKVLETPAYMRHRGAPVVSLWGYGFGHRRFDAQAAEELFRFLQRPENGGCTIMLGVPNDWAGWDDGRMRLLKEYATVISPWNVGRYNSPQSAENHFRRHWPKDMAFCEANDKDYYPVVFPGFSWTNLKKGEAPLDAIPRRRGRFLWGQFEQVRAYGMDMVYVAMFDEVDEGTAIFKVTNHPPVGRFVTYEGLPSDFYLTLTGLAGRMMRGEDVAFPDIAPLPGALGDTPAAPVEPR